MLGLSPTGLCPSRELPLNRADRPASCHRAEAMASLWMLTRPLSLNASPYAGPLHGSRPERCVCQGLLFSQHSSIKASQAGAASKEMQGVQGSLVRGGGCGACIHLHPCIQRRPPAALVREAQGLCIVNAGLRLPRSQQPWNLRSKQPLGGCRRKTLPAPWALLTSLAACSMAWERRMCPAVRVPCDPTARSQLP